MVILSHSIPITSINTSQHTNILEKDDYIPRVGDTIYIII